MKIVFHPRAWEDYIFWFQQDRRRLKRINELIRDIQRSPYDGIGKPELLRFELSGFWSRRIDHEHRLVYTVAADELHILACRFHYEAA